MPPAPVYMTISPECCVYGTHDLILFILNRYALPLEEYFQRVYELIDEIFSPKVEVIYITGRYGGEISELDRKRTYIFVPTTIEGVAGFKQLVKLTNSKDAKD